MVFGEYLVRLKILSKTQALNAISYQLDSIPSLFTFCKKKQLLDEDTLLKLSLAIVNDGDFIRLTQNQNLLSAEQLSDLIHSRNKEKIPFGQVCVKLNYMTLNEAQNHLSNYFKEIQEINLANVVDKIRNASEPNYNEQEVIIADSIESRNADTIETEQVQNENELKKEHLLIPNFEYREFDQELIHEFCTIFDEAKKSEIENEILRWPKDFNKDKLRNLYRDLHTFKGTSRFLGAHLLEFVIHNVESLLSEVILNADQIDEHFKKTLEDSFLSGIDIMWDIRLKICDFGTEEDYLNSASKEKIYTLLSNLNDSTQICLKLSSSQSVDDFVDQF